MAILGNRAFKDALDAGRLVIEPRPPSKHIGTNAIDLTLADEFKRWKQPRAGMEFTIDPAADGFSFQAITRSANALKVPGQTAPRRRRCMMV